MKNENTYLVEIKGLVQGVGFRPFIYRIARDYDLCGNVENRNDGVAVRINCNESVLNQFISSVRKLSPPASYIESITYKVLDYEDFCEFKIVKSKNVSDSITDVSPDIAVCNDCLADMKIQKNRINYPFINCTNCGPRFTIINNLPYDRDKTTMKDFIMCPDCQKEYSDIEDRRFHAQPIACDVCGPEYTLCYGNKNIHGTDDIVNHMADLIDKGKIISVKGLGGFFIACDAKNENAVLRLRRIKNREAKPFAVMFSSIEKVKEYAYVNKYEEDSLMSFRRPIVLLKKKKEPAASVTVGFNTLGVMLPYMPFHYLLFEKLKTSVIVLTSGNISDEPIIIDEKKDFEKLSVISDIILTYNRDIHNRTDDSIVNVINNQERIIRRSRGYVPSPFIVNMNVEGILGTGAELVNCFAIGKDNKAILSQHIGDLKNIETYEFYCETIERFKKLFNFNPTVIARDLHPQYLSSKYAEETNLQQIKVQHHHAHIASCMAEHKINEKVIGVSFDGTGYGDDNNIWGGEFFVCDFKSYKRVNHFDYIAMPGGDKVTEEPWRIAVSYLYKAFGKKFLEFDLAFMKNINPESVDFLCHAIDKKINSPLTSSSGRLFDAISALTNICTYSKFHAEAPMRLEAIIDKKIKTSYPFNVKNTILFEETIEQIVKDLKNNVSPSEISTKFHNTVISVICELADDLRDKHNINKVVLSGGTFQNKYLLKNVEILLQNKNFEVFSHCKIPTNDAGIALGQMAVASAILK